jgi:predicted esterase YcpF (UPF0227 family)
VGQAEVDDRTAARQPGQYAGKRRPLQPGSAQQPAARRRRHRLRAQPIDCMAMTPAPAWSTQRLLYLHGFRSSPRSFKAQRLGAWLATHRPGLAWCCPQLPPSPHAAMALARDLTAHWPADGSAVVGSSLGGFYALALAEDRGWPCVLLNPAVEPARDLAAHIGEQPAFHDPAERLDFRAEYVQELREIAGTTPPRLTQPQRCLAIVARGDEVLDWREMTARCAGARIELLEGGDHALSNFDELLPTVIGFLNP